MPARAITMIVLHRVRVKVMKEGVGNFQVGVPSWNPLPEPQEQQPINQLELDVHCTVIVLDHFDS